jgi:hypothetical protein
MRSEEHIQRAVCSEVCALYDCDFRRTHLTNSTISTIRQLMMANVNIQVRAQCCTRVTLRYHSHRAKAACSHRLTPMCLAAVSGSSEIPCSDVMCLVTGSYYFAWMRDEGTCALTTSAHTHTCEASQCASFCARSLITPLHSR